MRTVVAPAANHWLRAIVSVIAISARSIACSVGRPCRVTTAHVVGSWTTILIFLARGTGAARTSSTATSRTATCHRPGARRCCSSGRSASRRAVSLIVAVHIFHQTKQRRSPRQVHIALHAGLSEATPRDAADLDCSQGCNDGLVGLLAPLQDTPVDRQHPRHNVSRKRLPLSSKTDVFGRGRLPPRRVPMALVGKAN